jgi:hypothetical protein
MDLNATLATTILRLPASAVTYGWVLTCFLIAAPVLYHVFAPLLCRKAADPSEKQKIKELADEIQASVADQQITATEGLRIATRLVNLFRSTPPTQTPIAAASTQDEIVDAVAKVEEVVSAAATSGNALSGDAQSADTEEAVPAVPETPYAP